MIGTEVTSLVKSIAATALGRLLQEGLFDLLEDVGGNIDDAKHILLNGFESYMTKVYDEQKYISTLIRPQHAFLLDDIYISQTMTKSFVSDPIQVKIDHIDSDFLKSNMKILLTDTAGVGKSTSMKRIVLNCIRDRIAVPFLIELRNINPSNTILSEMLSKLHSFVQKFNEPLLKRIVSSGGLLIIFDGFDEIREDYRSDVTKQINMFISNAPKNYYIITSREDAALVSFLGFNRFNLLPLSRLEAFDLIKKYDVGYNKSELLIRKIKEEIRASQMERRISPVEDYLTNPLLITLLYSAFLRHPKLEVSKSLFYREIYEALYENFDLTKGDAFERKKISSLDKFDFQKVLNFLAFSMMVRGNTRCDKESLESILCLFLESSKRIKFTIPNFVRDVTLTVPLLLDDGDGFRWVHKSMMEYFAACYLHLDSGLLKQKYFNRLTRDSTQLQRHYNFFDLYSRIDEDYYQEHLIKKITQSYILRFVGSCDQFFGEKHAVRALDEGTLRLVEVSLALMAFFSKGQIDENTEACKNCLKKSNYIMVDSYSEKFNLDLFMYVAVMRDEAAIQSELLCDSYPELKRVDPSPPLDDVIHALKLDLNNWLVDIVDLIKDKSISSDEKKIIASYLATKTTAKRVIKYEAVLELNSRLRSDSKSSEIDFPSDFVWGYDM